MTQFSSLFMRIRFCQRERLLILICLLFGSLFGALCCTLHPCISFPKFNSISDTQPLLTSCFRASIFPACLTIAVLLRLRPLICLLFFLKGAAVSYAALFLADSGSDTFLLLLKLLLENLIPLPILIASASLWLSQRKEETQELWLLLCCLASVYLAAFLTYLLF